MTPVGISLEPELLRRYDTAGPRYTSYPTAPQFSDRFGPPDLAAAIARSNDEPIPRRLSLYVHVPFCESPCFYCGCNRIITRDKAKAETYLLRLYREIDLAAKQFDRDREVVQLHFGGGTPNFLSPAQLGEVVEVLRGQFNFSRARDRDISIELDPRFVSPPDIAKLADYGFNRASLGVQDFNPEVQAAVNRVQSIEETRAIVDACKTHGFESVNIDLIYGLPNQTVDRFKKTLDEVLDIGPDRLAVYGYAHLPHLFKPQKQLDASLLPTAQTRLRLLQTAIETLTAAGYVYIGMDHFALPGDSLARAQAAGSLHRNFMGYTTHAETDLLGLGVSAISKIGDTFSQNPRDLPGWETALDDGRLPVFRGMTLDEDDILRADLIQGLMCQGKVPLTELSNRYQIDAASYFQSELAATAGFEQDGLLQRDEDGLQVTTKGRLFLRNIAMCFDKYLASRAASTSPTYSRSL
ncbi:oxygen-independent coproporphyrinogen III oxidase [Lysobacter soyae]|uniref:Coproporphyrinogen-III oxidase n=1 Tax=Lysobacter soyae TaxID=2764185 RepID=A0ABX8WLL3_9GAMM|nr:oxygen-independent coproporphyrinogen III oxidase [Lysobacter sp. CJ11]QYR52525.1 oxygen-independent coproporphyrinogen III oxidase [Lysobacter sp. CJ11]